ncbi:helix-turn-helix domain-containing protein [Vibrio alfacsensis]|uniref:helix-turn-helix domain-containing protein n=1 Tax=Vibrio alfacsensis TaxID=1074311 RepID=UPI0040684D7E
MMDAISLGLTGIEKATLVHLSSFIDGKYQCFPSIKKLANITGFSESTMKRAVARLESLGVITKKRRYSNSGPTSNLYTLNLQSLQLKTQTKKTASPVNAAQFLAQDGNYYSCPAEFYKKKMTNQVGNHYA